MDIKKTLGKSKRGRCQICGEKVYNKVVIAFSVGSYGSKFYVHLDCLDKLIEMLNKIK